MIIFVTFRLHIQFLAMSRPIHLIVALITIECKELDWKFEQKKMIFLAGNMKESRQQIMSFRNGQHYTKMQYKQLMRIEFTMKIIQLQNKECEVINQFFKKK